VRDLLGKPRIVLTPVQRADLQAGRIDPRLIVTLAAIGRRHTVVITALQSDHYPGTNHAGRAMDIGAVGGQPCDGRRTGACAQLARELAAVEGALRSTELRPAPGRRLERDVFLGGAAVSGRSAAAGWARRRETWARPGCVSHRPPGAGGFACANQVWALPVLTDSGGGIPRRRDRSFAGYGDFARTAVPSAARASGVRPAR
jgi:hypothetical protein